jgi:regulator of sirC expression with transglutaminase-like and TPR domain
VSEKLIESLSELARRPEATVESVALQIAKEVRPGVQVERCISELDRLAEPLLARSWAGLGLEQLADELARYISLELGFVGNQTDYYDPDNSYLDRVLEQRKGSPVGLAVVWLALGRRAALPVEGITFPEYFLIRLGGVSGPLIDPFQRGMIVDDEWFTLLAAPFAGNKRTITREQLGPPATPWEVALRILRTLAAAYQKKENPAEAIIICDRLIELCGDAGALRMRGLHAMNLGATRLAIQDLEAYIAARPEANDVSAISHLLKQLRVKSTDSQ